MTAITVEDLDNAKLDVDLIAEVATSTEATATDRKGNVKLTVQGAMQTLIAVNPRGPWATATAYAVKDVFTEGGITYVAVLAHTSTSISADLAAGKIALYQGVTVQDTDHFQNGIDFTAGTDTQLTLSREPGSKSNVTVWFGSAYQGPNTWELSADVLIFDDPIPLGVEEVFVQIGTLSSTTLTKVSDESITDAMVAPATKLYVRINDEVSVTDPPFNAQMDGTDDSAAFDAAVAFCVAQSCSLWIPDGELTIPNASPITSGRLFLRGNGAGVIIGNVVYDNPTFPPSVDGPSLLDETAPFVSIRNLIFKSPNSSWALTVKAPVQGSFIDTMEMRDCKFYGQNGFRGQNLSSVSISNCWFYSSLIGIQAEGSTNWTVERCWFRSQAQRGFNVIPYAADPARNGGENIKFIGCEFAGCAVGVWLEKALWTVFDNCLFDYCGLPLFLFGTSYVKLSQSYLGCVILGSVAGIPGYQAPPVDGVALYARPYDAGGGNVFPSGFTATNCEFANYKSGSTLPIIIADGDVASNPSLTAIDRANMSQCKILTAISHSMNYMVSFSKAQVGNINACEFYSPDLSSSLLAPYSMANCLSINAYGNDSLHCTQSGVQVDLTQEKLSLGEVRMIDNTIGLAVTNEAGAECFEVRGSGNERVYVFAGSAMRLIGVGSADSAGVGFRQLVTPN